MKFTRRSFVAGMGAMTLAAAGLGGFIMNARQRRHRPNVIIFITDDMRYDATGFAGNSIIQTPHLDALAGDGIVFDNNFTTTSVCPVSRASIMSGQYALRHGVYDFHNNMRRGSFRHSFPVLMRESGYHTGFIGKWGMGGAQPQKAFDQWYGFEGQGNYRTDKNMHLTDLQTLQAKKFLNKCPVNQPFLLVVCYKAPHIPLEPQKRYRELYKYDTIPRAKTDIKSAAKKVPPMLKNSLDGRDYMNFHFNDENEYQRNMKKYYRLITGVDDSIGEILAHLQKDKRFADSNVIFTSDNGMLMGEHKLEGKWCMYEESIRTPMLMRLAPNYYPAVKANRQSALTLNIDLCPTLLEMASVAVPDTVQGQSLLQLVGIDNTSWNTPWREGFYYEHPSWVRQNVLACEGYRGLEWKYSRYMQGLASEECLFNLTTDPIENINLAVMPEYSEVLQHMREVTASYKNALQRV